MNIVVTGVTGLRNRGVEALVVTLVAGLRRHLPGARVELLTYDRWYDERLLEEVTVRANPFEAPPKGLVRRLAATVRQRVGGRLLGRAEAAIAGADMVVASGGDVFSSDYGRALGRHLAPLRLAQSRGVPVFFLGHSVGRFAADGPRAAFRAVAAASRGLTLREPASLRYALDDLGLPSTLCTLTADTAFLLEPAKGVDGLVGGLVADARGPVLACSVSALIARYAEGASDRHDDAWRSFLRRRLDEGFRCVLIPHVQERSPAGDDLLACSEVARRLGFPSELRIAPAGLRAAELKALVARADVVVAERMHAGIAGLSSGVPTLLVGYSIKAEGVLADVFRDGAARDRAPIQVDDFLDESRREERFADLWARRGEVRAALAARLPALVERAELNFRVLADAI